jgi:heme exporter protein CcmD
MQIVTDMGAHGAYVWPAYAAFVVILSALVLWATTSNSRARARLEVLEQARKSTETTK